MEFSIGFNTIMSGWSIVHVYLQGPLVIHKLYFWSSLFVLAFLSSNQAEVKKTIFVLNSTEYEISTAHKN